MKSKYLLLIILCFFYSSLAQMRWFSIGLEKDTVNAILLTSKSVLLAGSRNGLYYYAGTGTAWQKFDAPALPIIAIIELNADLVAVAAGGGSNSDGVYLGKFSTGVVPAYKFTLLTGFDNPHTLTATGAQNDTLLVGGAKAVSMIIRDNTGINPKVIPLKLPQYAFGVEQPICASLLCFPVTAANNNTLLAGGYDRGIMAGKGHLLQQEKDSLVILKELNISAMTQGVFAPVGPATLVVGTRDSGLYSQTSDINPVQWTHWNSPKDRPVNALAAVEGPMQGDQLLIAVDSGVFTGRGGTWQEVGDIPAVPLCFTGGIQLRKGYAGTDNGVYQYGEPTPINSVLHTNTASHIFSHYHIDKGRLYVTMNLPAEGRITITLYNLSGKMLCTVFEGFLEKGRSTIIRTINASDKSVLGTGIYLLRVSYNNICVHRTIVKRHN